MVHANLAPRSGTLHRHRLPPLPPPPLTETDLKSLFDFDDGTTVQADTEALRHWVEAVNAKARVKAAEAELDEHILELKKALEAASTLKDSAGRVLATWKSQRQKFLDGKRLKEEHPELVEEFTSHREFRKFLLKQPKVTK